MGVQQGPGRGLDQVGLEPWVFNLCFRPMELPGRQDTG